MGPSSLSVCPISRQTEKSGFENWILTRVGVVDISSGRTIEIELLRGLHCNLRGFDVRTSVEASASQRILKNSILALSGGQGG